MPALDTTQILDAFYGGIVKDDKSRVRGVASNIEELDIFSNKDYIQPERIFEEDTLPTGSELYAFTLGGDETLYGYGKETTNGYVRLFKLTSANASSPGSWETLFTSSSYEADNKSPVAFHEVTESGSQNQYLYYLAKSGTAWKLMKYGPLNGTASESVVGTLSGIGSYPRPWMLRLFGELYIGHGQYIAHIDDEGVFTEKKFTLPNGWEGVDAVGLSDTMLILCRSVSPAVNCSMIYQWDLTATSQFDDSIRIPMGGPQWIVNHKETIRVCCAMNGELRIYQLTGSFPIETHFLKNVAEETASYPVSPAKCVAEKEGILYFGVNGSPKTGIYALGQVDNTKPVALALIKRFSTTDYQYHDPIALAIAGPNFYAAYVDNGTYKVAKSTQSSPRSSNAVYESVWIDAQRPLQNKELNKVYLITKSLPANTSIKVYVASDFNDSYTEIKRADGSIYNTEGATMGIFRPHAFNNKKAFKVKLTFTSSGSNAPKLQAIGLRMLIKDLE